MINIAILEKDYTQSQLIEQALIGMPSNWDEPAEVKRFEYAEMLFNQMQSDQFDCLVVTKHGTVTETVDLIRELHHLTKRCPPIIILSERKNTAELVSFYEAGADEYLVKPLAPEELLVRAKKLVEKYKLIRMTGAKQVYSSANSLHQNSDTDFLEFDDFNMTITNAKQLVKLTEVEYSLAKLLLSHIGANLSREFLFKSVWGDSVSEKSGTLATHIHRIREKLELTAENGWILRSIYGFGYRLDYGKQSLSNDA